MSRSPRSKLAVVVTAVLALAFPVASLAARAPKKAAPMKPAISRFSPASVAAMGRIVVFGRDFLHVKRVTVDGRPAKFKLDSAKKLTVTIPAKAKSGRIVVFTSAGKARSAKALKIKA